MKKEITKIWGVGLTIVLAASLLFSMVPVSAGTLSWSEFSPITSTTGNVLAPGSNVADLDVADDGTMYLVTSTDNFCYKSTNDGVTWSKLTKNFGDFLTNVAVAPDDSDVVAVVNVTDEGVWISTDGGSTFGSLGAPAGSTTINVYDLAVSPTDGTKNYVALAGDDGTGDAEIWYFDVGASAPSWTATSSKTGFVQQDDAMAVEFSPNVASDKVMVAVTANAATVQYQMFSLSTKVWNTPFDDYPVEVYDGTDSINTADNATIALAPDYLGSDDSMRIAFVGIDTGDGTARGGIYRLKDTSVKDIYDGTNRDIRSIDYDGTDLVAGGTQDTKIYRCDDPLATSPTFSTASTLKRPGLSTTGVRTIVQWKGSDVVAGTSGTGSAFAVSTDNGKSFNDLSMIDTENGYLTNIDDITVSDDGSTIFMLMRDANALSLFRYSSSWQRVLTIASGTGYIVRIAPDDPDAVYVGQTGETTLYYSQEGGDTKWFSRTAKDKIGDMVVESASVAYIAVDGAKTVGRTTNGGFTWSTAEPTGVGGNSIATIATLGENKIIVGSDTGYVAWSTDGNDSWSKVNTQLNGEGPAHVTATGLSDGDFIYAACQATATRVERWEIGQSGSTWKNLEAPTTAGYSAYGIALRDGVLYVSTANTSDSESLRTISPGDADPSSGMWSSMTSTALFTATPSALKVSSGTTLWTADQEAATASKRIYSYTDEVSQAGPTLVSPRDGATVEMNPVSGSAYSVAFSWERPSKAKVYDLQVSLDSGFTEKIYSANTSSTTSSVPSVVLAGTNFMPDTKYYWKVRVAINGPVRSPWSEVRAFTITELPEALPSVVVQQPPAPVISVPPAPSITITPPEIVLPPAPAPPPEIVIPPAPAPPAPITPAYIWAIVIIGAILVIALIVLIVRTRRPV